MPDIICLGELLIDFISMDRDRSLVDSSGFLKNPGGAPANVAVGAVRLGASAGFIGKVGEDPFGYYLRDVLKQNGVDTWGLAMDPAARTTLSFVAQRSDGVRECMFYRNPGADMLLSPEDIDPGYFREALVFHYGSISFGSEKSEAATLRAIANARANGMLLSYDPNLRPSLWDSEQKAREKINEGFRYADFVKISDEEFEFITGAKTPEACAKAVLAKGCGLVIVTLGKNGCYYSDGRRSGTLSGRKVKTVETTGAGDAFVAAMLCALVRRMKSGERTVPKVDDALVRDIQFANCAAALATTKMGAIPALPETKDVEAYMWTCGDANGLGETRGCGEDNGYGEARGCGEAGGCGETGGGEA